MDDTSLEYFKRRAVQESRRAREAPSREAAEVHRQMALGYEDRIAGVEDGSLNWAGE